MQIGRSTRAGKLLRSFNTATLCITLSIAPAAFGKPIEPISFDSEQSKIVIDITNKLISQHYNGQPLNDSLSSRLLDNYIERLDGNRSYFIQPDLKEFEKFRYTLDDTLNKGDLKPGFAIFNRYQQRLIDRLERTIELLPTMVAAMDFNRKEELELDRSESSWPINIAEADDLWRKRIKSRIMSLRFAKKPEEEIVPLLVKRYQNQLNQIKQTNSEDAFQIYVNALASLYDPHTSYFSPTTSENFNINMSLSLEGIGAVLQVRDEYTSVVRVVPSGPADKQGDLQPSDRIVAVAQGDGEFQDVIGLRLDDVVKLICGEKNSVVRLEIIPVSAKTDDERAIVKIVRNTVKLEEQSAQKKVMDIYKDGEVYKIGIIDIPAFYIDFGALRKGDKNYKSTTRDVSKLLSELEEEGVDGVVIDLRENGGGSLQEANQLTGLFVESGPTVQIRHSNTQVFRDGKRNSSPYYSGPLAVLINRLSASASEIFAGAIQDYQRGIIVGSQSFGKGTVQSLTALEKGQLKITESKFYRISGESTQHRGVIPDIEFPALYDHEKVGESSLDNALAWDRINPIRHQRYFRIDSVLPTLKKRHAERMKVDPDFIFLQDQLALIEESRKLKTLPLNQEERTTFFESEKEKSLNIENKRRLAKGLDLVADLDEEVAASVIVGNGIVTASAADTDESAESTPESSSDTEASEEEKEEPIDALLTETGNILVDAFSVFSSEKKIAVNHRTQK
ncbi:MAG: carboxyl-terminal processing protease [Oceanicoccus sp.]|jgi:carboxyl-terminal processing protease